MAKPFKLGETVNLKVPILFYLAVGTLTIGKFSHYFSILLYVTIIDRPISGAINTASLLLRHRVDARLLNTAVRVRFFV